MNYVLRNWSFETQISKLLADNVPQTDQNMPDYVSSATSSKSAKKMLILQNYAKKVWAQSVTE